MAVPQIDGRVLDKKALMFLGQEYVREIANLESARQELTDNYELWIDNYEGKTLPTDAEKPWDGASEGHLPKTATDVDVTFARFMNAIFGQFPKFMIRPLSGKWVEFARETQKFSEWLEESEIPLYKTIQQSLLISIKFGSVVIYAPWENDQQKYMKLDENDVFQETERDEEGRPALKVIHPKDWLLPINSTDIQKAQWCGYKYKLKQPKLKLWTKRGFFSQEVGKALLAEFSLSDEEGKEGLEIPKGEEGHDRTQDARERNVGIVRNQVTDELDMVHIWARIDVDGDGMEEEVNFHMHLKTGRIARIAFNHYRHGKRPFVDFHFFPRDGVWYSIGIPEMLRAVQKNINVTFRQIQDNNTVKNTQAFKAKEGGSITPDETFHPARIYFVREMDELETFKLGDSSMNTSVQDLETMLNWGDRRTGINDPAQGIGGNDRTPATTTLALLQEASRRIDLIIGQTREGLSELWTQVLELYAQFKPVVEFEVESSESETGEKFQMLEWHAMDDDQFRKRVMIKPTASTTALNKAIARTEMQGLLESMLAFNQTQMGMMDLFLQAQDPALKGYIGKSLSGQTKVMQRVLDTFEFAKDEKEILPNPEELFNVNPLQPPVQADAGAGAGGPQGATGANPTGGPPGAADPVPRGAAAGSVPPTAPGRPANDGIPRLPGQSAGGVG